MKFEKKDLKLKDGIRKEWVITNGLGAICSSSILGANTRRYHGLLVAPLLPPARRHLLISKLDETIQIGEQSYNLYSNICENYISDGFKYLESFEKEYIPTYTYNVNGVKIIKQISMVYKRNTVVVTYRIENCEEKSKLILTPVINFRDFHALSTGHRFSLRQKIAKGKVRVEVDGNASTPIYMYIKDTDYIEHIDDTFENMYYLKEDERGFYPEENLAVSGRFELEIEPNENKEITFIGSLEENIEEIDGFKVILKEIERQKKVVEKSELLLKKPKMQKADIEYNDFIENLVLATDSFIIFRPSFGLHSILAGIPWFLDWGRDAMIAFEGTVLVTKRFDIAREILLTFTRDIKFGLVPNGYSGFDNRPLYNSADASLLLFEAVYKYLRYTNDMVFVKGIYSRLKSIIKSYIEGIDIDNNNIYLDEDYLIVARNTRDTKYMDGC